VVVADPDGHTFEVVATLARQIGIGATATATGQETLAAARSDLPTLVLIEVDLTSPAGYEVCRQLREEFGETLPIAFMSATRTSIQDEIAALLIGADDYFIKPLQPDRFLARVRRLVARAAAPPARSTLTAREREVLRLLVDGRRPAEIADLLCITRKTASTHIEHILAKLGAHSQAQAVAFALRDNLLGAPVAGP
jgi:DNA-binding NarL/FixJ family response regulator